ncbi:MAG: thioredoxin [Gammaproteobacteria bacterium 39-13]|nr:thioredoxin [Gammaproteobacteria bacterium]OJV85317.1 MAG: thioredoxin [Gammaproteobacteria bacterium 39-13]
MSIITLTQHNFDEVIQNNDVVVVDFWAKWCGPCLAFSPVFEQISKHHEDVIFAKVDIDAEIALANDFNIRSIPFLMIFRREFAVFAEAGVQTATALDALVNDAKKIDLAKLRAQLQNEEE